MRRLVKVAIALVLGVLVINGTNAQPINGQDVAQRRGYGQEFRRGAGYGQQHAIHALNLSDDQEAKIRELHLNVQKETLPLRNKVGENIAKLRTLQTAESPDMKAINKLIDENAEIRADIAKNRAATHQEVRKLLTEEQRIIFNNHSPRDGFQRGKGRMGRGIHRGDHGFRRGNGDWGRQGRF